MRGFKNGDTLTDVATGRDAESANLGGCRVGEIVSVEIRSRDHGIFGWAKQQLLEHGVGDAVANDHCICTGAFRCVALSTGCLTELFFRNLVAPVTEGALGELHDVPLVHERH
ncbi:hypothetical protein D3C83_52210 [compost metagenome]